MPSPRHSASTATPPRNMPDSQPEAERNFRYPPSSCAIAKAMKGSDRPTDKGNEEVGSSTRLRKYWLFLSLYQCS
jgi:hypothetical protein